MIALIVKFIVIQLLQALITANMVKDSILEVLKLIATHTKNTWDDKIYKKVKYYFYEDKSEHLQLPPPSTEQVEEENK